MKVRVTRDVGACEDGNYAGRDVLAGEELYVYEGHDYDCIDWNSGLALSMAGRFETPFFQFPRDAVEGGEDIAAGRMRITS